MQRWVKFSDEIIDYSNVLSFFILVWVCINPIVWTLVVVLPADKSATMLERFVHHLTDACESFDELFRHFN